MTIAEIAHSATSFGRFQSWAARYSGPELINRPDLGRWSMTPAGLQDGASLTVAHSDLVYRAGEAVHGFVWRDGRLRTLAHGERVVFQAGDRYILCTAGVLHALGDTALASLVAADEDAPAERLVLAALAADAADTIAAITIEVVAGDIV